MLWRGLKAWQVYGANTDVGKTIISTILCKALQRRAPSGALYLKPVSTGLDADADDKHIRRYAPGVTSRCISQFSKPVSPHIAARSSHGAESLGSTSDSIILRRVKNILNEHAEAGGRYALVETAGAVLSPSPSGTVQADFYRPLRLPTVLIGDSKLGGIGGTISAFESLHIRGYDVDSVVLFDDPEWQNWDYLAQHFQNHGVPVHGIPMPPLRQADADSDKQQLSEYYDACAESNTISELIKTLDRKWFSRSSKLRALPSHAKEIVWHPFRQHNIPHNIIAIDSAYKDHFQAYNEETDALSDPASPSTTSSITSLPNVNAKQELTPLFDASASWWTQGLGHGNPTLSLMAAYAAGRYGHVMFAHAVHEPAIDISYNLLSTLANPRLSRVFFTDNGSTGMEVAVKMALRASCQRYGWSKDDGGKPVGILGLQGSYHGDTIGVMNCSEPSIFNDKVDWYKPWGYWFEPPQILMRNGKWEVTIPSIFSSSDEPVVRQFTSLNDIFDFGTRPTDYDLYKSYITHTLRQLVHDQGHRFGALLLEPLIMGAGGMIFVDPLFQRTLITTIRENPSLINPSSPNNASDTSKSWSGLPFIADEVFTGLFRLGRHSSSSFLSSPDTPSPTSHPTLPTSTSPSPYPTLSSSVAPDISAHAKLLTGGLLPLAITTASEEIFSAFLSSSKTDALLHGHSYTAHPIGCAVADRSLNEMKKLEREGKWDRFKAAWSSAASSSSTETNPASESNTPFSFFSPKTLTKLSNHPQVEGCWALGTVLAVTLKSESGSGYNSTAASSLQAKLLTTLDSEGAGVHSRVLGDVIYFMTSLTTPQEQVERLEGTIFKALDAGS